MARMRRRWIMWRQLQRDGESAGRGATRSITAELPVFDRNHPRCARLPTSRLAGTYPWFAFGTGAGFLVTDQIGGPPIRGYEKQKVEVRIRPAHERDSFARP